MMIQLMINGTAYPQASRDRYKCYTKELGESLRMLSSRLVTEVRAAVTIIEYSYDSFDDALMRQCLADLRGRENLRVQYLDAGSDALKSGVFRCVKLPAPSFAFADRGKARWHNIAFQLEEVEGR